MAEPDDNRESFSSKNWKARFFTWNIQLSIVSIFIILIGAYTLILTIFTYQANYREVMKLSSMVTAQANERVARITSGITNQVKLLAEATKGLLFEGQDISSQNQMLSAYLLHLVEKDEYIYRIRIATSEGNVLSATNVVFADDAQYHLNPVKELPVGVKYALRSVNRSVGALSEIWEYKDADMQTIETEVIPFATYDPRTEAWYREVAEWPHFQWEVIESYALGESGAAVTVPVVGSDGKVFAVVNVIVSLKQLSNSIALQKIEKTGRAFILNTNGEIIVPTIERTAEQNVFPLLVEKAYQRFQNKKEKEFLLKNQGEEYLVNISEFPLDYNTKWMIAVIVPFDDFFGPIQKIQEQRDLISIGLLILFGIFVYLASRHIAQPIVKLADAVDKIQHFDFQEPTPIHSHISEIISLKTSFGAMRKALHSFSRYIPREIVKTLINQGQEIAIGGERRDITVFFSDIENFTTVAEAFHIEELTSTLSEYFEVLCKIIVSSGGTVDKFIGDGVMAFWNAPSLVVDQGDKACLAALECLKMTHNGESGNVLLKARTRFGIHSGEAIVGNIGTLERMNYTAIGNVVNTAARLQGLNKIYGTSIIISETTHEKVGTRYVTRPLDFIVAKGRTKGITVYELVGIREAGTPFSASPEQIELCDSFTGAYEKFHAGKVDEAKAAFAALHKKFPADPVTKLYLERLQITQK